MKYHVITWIVLSGLIGALLIHTIDWWQFIKPASIYLA
jgi:hypothetical protein